MSKNLLRVSALAAVLAGSSPVLAEPLSWTGPWVGVTAAMRTDMGAARSTGASWLPSDETFRGNTTHPAIGLNAGYDFQFGRLVAGPIAGFDFSTSPQSGNTPYFGARAGFLVTPELLLFVMGGAQSTQNAANVVVRYALPSNPFFMVYVPVGAKTGRRWGGFVGAGAEFRLAANWAVTADYSFSQTHGDFSDEVNSPYPPYARRANLTTAVASHTFRFGVKYHLGGASETAAGLATPGAPAAEPMNWTGAWASVNAGVRTDAGLTHDLAYLPSELGSRYRSTAFGGTIGIGAGYDVQIGRLVGGVIAGMDFSTSRLSGNMPYFGVRAGVLASERLLLFLMGGAQSMQNAPAAAAFYGQAPLWVLSTLEYGAKAGRRWGPFIGGGAEYRLSANWSFNADYSYSHTRGRFDGAVYLPNTSYPFGVSQTTEVSTHIFRLGVKYRL